MTSPSTTINITVTLTPNGSKPSGYQFAYGSDSNFVSSDGTIDLSSLDKDDVQLVFTLAPMAGGVQPTFQSTHDASVYFASWPKNDPSPPPCPEQPNAFGTFKDFSLPSSDVLQFTDKNKDNKRFTYALRCTVPGIGHVVADDPGIVNK